MPVRAGLVVRIRIRRLVSGVLVVEVDVMVGMRRCGLVGRQGTGLEIVLDPRDRFRQRMAALLCLVRRHGLFGQHLLEGALGCLIDGKPVFGVRCIAEVQGAPQAFFQCTHYTSARACGPVHHAPPA